MKKILLTFISGLIFVACGSISSPTQSSSSVPDNTEISNQNQATTLIASTQLTDSPATKADRRVLSTPTVDAMRPTRAAALQLTESSPDCANILRNVEKKKDVPGIIYLWNNDPKEYMMYSPAQGFTSLIELAPRNSKIPDPRLALSLAFPTNISSRKIAYIVSGSEGYLELWVTDLNLCRSGLIWKDTNRWLADTNDDNLEGRIKVYWGPNDKTLLLESSVKDKRFIIYSLLEQKAFARTGECNKIFQPGAQRHWSLICTLQEKDYRFGILGWNGSVNFVSSIPEGQTYSVIAWAFSPKGDQALLVNQAYEIFLIKSAEERINLPISWSRQLEWQLNLYSPKHGIRWSNDGDKLLVFGYDRTGERCQTTKHPETGDRINLPCWQIFDLASLKAIWWIDKETLAKNEIPSINPYTYYEATFSPDGKWIALFFSDTPLHFFLITSIDSKQFYKEGDFIFDNIYWTTEE